MHRALSEALEGPESSSFQRCLAFDRHCLPIRYINNMQSLMPMNQNHGLSRVISMPRLEIPDYQSITAMEHLDQPAKSCGAFLPRGSIREQTPLIIVQLTPDISKTKLTPVLCDVHRTVTRVYS